MKTLELTATVEANRKLIVQLPPDIPPGEHRVVLVIDEQPLHEKQRMLPDFPVIHVDHWPEDLSLRRADLYDEHGR